MGSGEAIEKALQTFLIDCCSKYSIKNPALQGFLFLALLNCAAREKFKASTRGSSEIQHYALANLLILKYNLTLIEKSNALGWLTPEISHKWETQ